MTDEPQEATPLRQCSACWCILPVDQMRLNEARYGSKAQTERVTRWFVCHACAAKQPQQQALTVGDGSWYERELDL